MSYDSESPEPKNSHVFKSALMALWAMGTLVLFFCVVLLVYQMVQQGDDPLGFAAAEERIATGAANEDVPTVTAQEIRLYYADTQRFRIAPESRRIEHTSSTVENCRRALAALIEGPSSQNADELAPVISPQTIIRGVYLVEGGELVIDVELSRDLGSVTATSAAEELLMAQCVVATLTQPRLRGSEDAAVRKVRFLFAGDAPQDTYPSHIDLSEPVEYDPDWVSSSSEGQADA